MKKLQYILMAATAVLLLSCSKELDIDYDEIAPIYVIEGDITDQPAKVLITTTRSVNDSVKGSPQPGALVTITDDQGKSEALTYGSDGYYRSPSGWSGETGRTYTLNVKIAGKEFTASSTMREAAKLDSMQFVFSSAAGMKMMLLKHWDTYPTTQEICYTHSRMYKNGKFYRSGTGKQTSLQVLHSEALLGCTTQKKMEDNLPEDADVILFDNDKIRLELWSIDASVHEYFTSLQIGRNNASNPITNISGGALGYFSAHHISVIETTFFRKDIKESN